jgi:hypothetical protein
MRPSKSSRPLTDCRRGLHAQSPPLGGTPPMPGFAGPSTSSTSSPGSTWRPAPVPLITGSDPGPGRCRGLGPFQCLKNEASDGWRHPSSSARPSNHRAEHDCKGLLPRRAPTTPAPVRSRLSGHSGRLWRIAGLTHEPRRRRGGGHPRRSLDRTDRACRIGSLTKWRPGGHRARHGRRYGITLVTSDRPVRIVHTCAPEGPPPSGRAPQPLRNRVSRRAKVTFASDDAGVWT